jgi:hypothetical protein
MPATPVAIPAATRGGDDTRRRGWFWHWNSIVTQYAPLIGLKGIGLLNSYTVWTDRREESPHRGFAFPSQQREADFYGEDRAELITINKLLVALDLIEIRKEMVLRVDEQGRRWKVPHNFYRVKDHDDGSSLTADAVLAVAHLADHDRAVYRYVRRVFSPRFAAIDRDNVWSIILDEVRSTDVWQRLAARALKDETRASDRTRAGHAARKGALFLADSGDSTTPLETANDSSDTAVRKADGTNVAPINIGSDIDVASANNGSMVAVDPANNGLTPISATSVAGTNTGRPTGVDQTNRTYNQDALTTTTTTRGALERSSWQEETTPGDRADRPGHNPVTTESGPVTGEFGVVLGLRQPPSDGPAEQRAIKAFEDANGRQISAAERTLLSQLAEQFDRFAQPGLDGQQEESGWALATAAIYEAVESGSAFVAPRRIREIMTRWERDGRPDGASGAGRNPLEERVPGESASRSLTASRGRTKAGREIDRGVDRHGLDESAWTGVLSRLRAVVDASDLETLQDGVSIVSMRDEEITIAAAGEAVGELIEGQYRTEIEGAFQEVRGIPGRISVFVPETAPALPVRPPVRPREIREPAVPAFILPECGLPSSQVWEAIVDEVAAAGEVSQANVDSWLRSTRLIGRGPGGSLIVGAAHSLARRRIESRFADAVAQAVEAVLGTGLSLEFVIANEWLAARSTVAAQIPEEDAGAA